MNKKYHVVLFTMCAARNEKPFGAHKIAHELRNQGLDVLVINYLDKFTVEELTHILTQSVSDQTLFVGFSTTYLDFSKAETPVANIIKFPPRTDQFLPHPAEDEIFITQHIKQLNPNCKIVVGGARIFHDCKNKRIDYAVIGYADLSVIYLANYLLHGTPIIDRNYKNIYGVHIIDGGLAKDFDFNNSTMTWCEDDIVIPGEILPLEVSRGCIFSCKFCNWKLNGKSKVDYIKHPDILYNELYNNYINYGVTQYRMLDDTFNDTEEKIDAITDVVNRLPFTPSFSAYIRLDLLTAKPHTIPKLVNLGLRSMFFGIETLNKETGSIIGKGGSPEKLIQTIIDIKQTYGDHVDLLGSFICGLPQESKESVLSTMERLITREIPLDIVLYSPLAIDRQNSTDWASSFSLDYKKYGYREDPDKAIFDEIINWENDYMTYQEAKNMTQDFAAKYGRPRKSVIMANDRNMIELYKKELANRLH